MQVEYRGQCLSGLTGYKLQKVLDKNLGKLRKAFWIELQKDLDNIDKFINDENTLAFFIFNEYSYVLGKYDTLLLDIDGREQEVPIMLIAELYVAPKYRNKGIARFLIRDIQFEAKNREIPVICGCDRSLKSFYEHMEFYSIEVSQEVPSILMVWDAYYGTIKKSLEKFVQG